MRSLLLVALSLVAVSAFPKQSQRIIGGSQTTINQYPQMAALLYSFTGADHRQSCGGTIINNRSILTAAHCTIDENLNRWRTRLGSTSSNSGGTVYNIAQIINHPSFNMFTIDNDIAIIRTTSSIVFSNNVVAGSFAGANYNVADNQVVWAVGWGATVVGGQFAEQLRHVQVWTINQNACRERYGSRLTDNMLCSGWLDVGGRDACTGDSGGPLFHNGVVIGVTSWGDGCGQARYPGVSARVQRYPAWISANA